MDGRCPAAEVRGDGGPRGRWLGAQETPLAGWVTVPTSGARESGALILPAVAYEYWSAHRTLRTMAEALAGAGHVALRLDYEGTGDSSGDPWSPGQLDGWRRSVMAGAAELRRMGCRRLVVVGLRLGATLALELARELDADRVVAWRPVVSGRRYVRELRLMGTALPAEARSDGVAIAGVVFTEATLADLRAIDLPRQVREAPSTAEVVILAQDEGEAVVEAIRAAGGTAAVVEPRGDECALERPAEYATVPSDVIDAVCTAAGPAAPGPADTPPREIDTGADTATLLVDGQTITERFVRVGPGGLAGVLSTPTAAPDQSTTVVFLNTGSEPHVGPGRAWVEYARALASAGHPALRVDFSGWGESPDRGYAPGRPYDAHCVSETEQVVRWLRGQGRRVILVGLCASAWVALRAVLTEEADGVVALNPQLYWRPGDPVEALMSETRARRAPQRRREQRGRRWRLWDVLDFCGSRPFAGRWLDALGAGRTPVLLLFAEGDDGIEYLRNRVARRLRAVTRRDTVDVREIADIDHSMHAVWRRPAVIAALLNFAAQVAAGEEL